MYFKFYNPSTDIKLIRQTLEHNGIVDISHANRNYSSNTTKSSLTNSWTIMWSCSIMKSNVFQSLRKNQRVNHFPKSYELTRKDFLNERLMRMQQLHGKRNYNFAPKTFTLPKDLELLQKEMESNPSQWWIIKPSAAA